MSQQGYPPAPGDPYSQQPFGGYQQGGAYPPPPGYDPYSVPRRRGPNVILIVLGIVLVCIIACCGIGAYAASTPPAIILFWSAGLVGDSSNNSSISSNTVGVMCDGSPAIDFTNEILVDYPAITDLTFTNIIETNDQDILDRYNSDKVYSAEGTITYEGGTTEDFDAYFIMGDDAAFLGFLGNCIQDIELRTEE